MVGLEDDPFLLGFGNFSGAFAVKLQGGIHVNIKMQGGPWIQL